MQLAIIGAIAAAIAAVAFALQNNVPVTVNFLLWRFDSSLAMVLLLALAVGAIIVALLTTPATLARQWQLARQKRHIEELEKTCDGQRSRIADLESRHPAQVAESRPYVGLRELITGERHAEAKEPEPPPG